MKRAIFAAVFCLAAAGPAAATDASLAGLIQGLSEAAQDVSPQEMKRLQGELGKVLARDPDVAAFGSFFGRNR